APRATAGGPRSLRRRYLVLVKRFARDLAPGGVPQSDGEVRVGVGVGSEQREAVLGDRALVDGARAQLGGRDRAAAHERDAPHERHRRDLFALAAPAADRLLGDVELPVGVLVGGVGRVIGPAVELARLV